MKNDAAENARTSGLPGWLHSASPLDTDAKPESQQRALPIRLDPIPGEALDSWLAALAYRLHTPLGELLPELGSPRRTAGHPGDIPTEWTVLLRPAEINALASATGARRSTIEAMTLCRYDGQALFIDPATRQVRRGRLWGRNTGSRYCPDCLAETGGRWQLSWRLGWSFALPTGGYSLIAVPAADAFLAAER